MVENVWLTSGNFPDVPMSSFDRINYAVVKNSKSGGFTALMTSKTKSANGPDPRPGFGSSISFVHAF